jgi:hypothetical protein
MTEKRAHRRLAAILAADVVGYSREKQTILGAAFFVDLSLIISNEIN